MYILELIKPIHLDDLTRVGQNSDGGYVLSKRQIDRTDILLSFGINEDWSFDSDFLKLKNNATLYACDYSVSACVLQKRILYCMLKSIKTFVRMDFKQTKYWMNILCRKLNLLWNFYCFFVLKRNSFFIKKFLGNNSDKMNITVSEIFDKIEKRNDISIFVKMDIEESEYLTLDAFMPFYDSINGFAIEFHKLDIYGDKFMKITDELLKSFYVAHVHANNYGSCINGTSLPDTLEITLINKKFFTAQPEYSHRSYPITGLDFPCNLEQPDFPLHFE